MENRLRFSESFVDYRQLRPGNLNSERFRHLWLLLFWPIYGLAFAFVERWYQVPEYHIMYMPLDDKIPFCEYFLIPYLFWFVFLVGIIVYTLFFDTECFKKFMWYIIITYSVTIIIYLIYPTAQELRPESFARDNVFTRFIAGFYEFDTNTNVCPSIHVIGSLAVMFAAWNSKHFSTPGWKAAFAVVALLICVSTVFLKQHSIVDVFAAIPLCLIAYPIAFRKRAAQSVRA